MKNLESEESRNVGVELRKIQGVGCLARRFARLLSSEMGGCVPSFAQQISGEARSADVVAVLGTRRPRVNWNSQLRRETSGSLAWQERPDMSLGDDQMHMINSAIGASRPGMLARTWKRWDPVGSKCRRLGSAKSCRDLTLLFQDGGR